MSAAAAAAEEVIGVANDDASPETLRPCYQNRQVTLFCGNIRAVLPRLELPELAPGKRIHILTDPPYSANTQDNSRAVLTGGRRTADGSIVLTGERKREFSWAPLNASLMKFCAKEFARLTTGWALVFSDDWLDTDWRRQMTRCGMKPIRRLLWRKTQAAPLIRGDRPAAWTESVVAMHASGHRMFWNGGGKGNVYEFAREGNKINASVKPLPLMKQIVQDFTDPGDLIIDAFSGTGTTLLAAQEMGRYAIGIEKDRRQCDYTIERLNQIGLPFEREIPLRVKFRSQQPALVGVEEETKPIQV